MSEHDMNPDRAEAAKAEAMTDERREKLAEPLKTWVSLEGQRIQPGEGRDYYYSGEIMDGSNDRRGTFNGNNGTLLAIDGNGRYWASRQSKTRLEALAEAGYVSDPDLAVPLSNGERLVDPHKQVELTMNQDRAVFEKITERYAEAAAEANLSKVDGEWMRVNGMMIQPLDGEVYASERAYDPHAGDQAYEVYARRTKEIGTFDANNRVVAFVDGEGVLYAAPATDERLEALRKAGYRHEQLGVPLSKGEKPAALADQEKWDRMLAEAHGGELRDAA